MSPVKLAFSPAKVDHIQERPSQTYVDNTMSHADLSHDSDTELDLCLDLHRKNKFKKPK